MATSINGKTITKPFTANQGGYFTFTTTADTPYDADMFDFDTQPMPKENITFTLGSNWVTEDTSEDVPTDIMMAKSFENSQEISKTGWFNLSGSKLNSKPTRKGIYIHDGKKYVVVRNE